MVDYINALPRLGVVEFQESLVIYKAGAIPLLNVTPKLIFTNCAFQISPNNPENKEGQKLINDLLQAQNPAAVAVDLSGE